MWKAASVIAITAWVLIWALTSATVWAGPRHARAPEAASACKIIRTAAQLQAIGDNASGSFCLANDIDLSSISNFAPLNLTNGHFFGNGHTIRNLTINNSVLPWVGLFGLIADATVQDLRLVNVDVRSTGPNSFVGGLVGRVADVTGITRISNVHVDGKVRCLDACSAGGLAGVLEAGGTIVTGSSSAAAVTGPKDASSTSYVGGFVGVNTVTIRKSYATGNVFCEKDCDAGGLAGYSSGEVDRCGASGTVSASDSVIVGGLIGRAVGGAIRRSHATGAVATTGPSFAGGLIGYLDGGTLSESYSATKVAAASSAGGLIGLQTGSPTVTSSYWDTQTSLLPSSAGGTGRTTAQLRAALPMGFGPAWANTKGRSYPFLDDVDIDFAIPLATVLSANAVSVFLPLGQLEESNYKTKPAHESAASRAAVYTMIARAIGNTYDEVALRNATISSYWNDTAQIATFAGPIKTFVKLGPLLPIAANAGLTNANVIGKLKAQQLVILRGRYSKDGGGTAKHWMLATLYTATPSGAFNAVVANDPWTGKQVMIDPQTKTVLTPNFPLKNFKVDGYQTATLIDPD